MIFGFAILLFGYALFYWGWHHFTPNKRYSLWDLLGLKSLDSIPGPPAQGLRLGTSNQNQTQQQTPSNNTTPTNPSSGKPTPKTPIQPAKPTTATGIINKAVSKGTCYVTNYLFATGKKC
jgi:hypothetical protein